MGRSGLSSCGPGLGQSQSGLHISHSGSPCPTTEVLGPDFSSLVKKQQLRDTGDDGRLSQGWGWVEGGASNGVRCEPAHRWQATPQRTRPDGQHLCQGALPSHLPKPTAQKRVRKLLFQVLDDGKPCPWQGSYNHRAEEAPAPHPV